MAPINLRDLGLPLLRLKIIAVPKRKFRGSLGRKKAKQGDQDRIAAGSWWPKWLKSDAHVNVSGLGLHSQYQGYLMSHI